MANPEGVHMFMGVNGVGKSTLTKIVGEALPDAQIIHASQELRRMFGVVNQKELEELSPDEKLARRTARLLELFRGAREEGRLVLLDTHLLVPIRKDGKVRYENTWADEYADYVAGAYMLTADPADIRDWRESDAVMTGRPRDLSIEGIGMDQQLNVQEFTSLVDRGALPDSSQIIRNQSGIARDIGLNVLNQILATP